MATYKDNGDCKLGRCEAHKGIHIKHDDCEDFELASTKDVAEDTWKKLSGF